MLCLKLIRLDQTPGLSKVYAPLAIVKFPLISGRLDLVPAMCARTMFRIDDVHLLRTLRGYLVPGGVGPIIIMCATKTALMITLLHGLNLSVQNQHKACMKSFPWRDHQEYHTSIYFTVSVSANPCSDSV